ncbi:hypothetical protein FQN51_007211 [Onygenales sp. PD_10]|nr:hypothetical protein FQN51_007211 [Onygenales sp. PD_10]
MPPKAARGRGRGRGRGAASTSTSRTPIEIDSASPSPAPGPAPTTTQPPDTTTPIEASTSTSIPTTTTTTTTTTRPRTTTAPVPTPTPTPVPATRGGGVQRLQSLKKRTPAGSLIPLNADGSTPKPTLRYQPRAVVRRSKEEREAMERLEAERNAERIAEAKAVRGGADRGGRGGRGRGRGRGRGGSFVAGEVGGPLGSGVSMRSRGGGVGGYSGGGGGGGKGKYGRAAGGGGKMTGIVGGRGGSMLGAVGTDEEEGGEGEDGEFEGKEKGKGKMPARGSVGGGGGRGLRPVRVERHEHQERSVGVNTEASSNKSAELRKQAKSKAKQGGDDSLFVQDDEAEEGDDEGDVEMVSERAVRGGRAAGDGEIRIKEEPTDGDVLMSDSIPQATDEAPKPTPKKKRVTIKDPRSKLQTEEEKQEYDRHEQDIEHIKKALGTLTTLEKTPVDGEPADQAEGEAKTEEPKDERSGRLFLIQFPPTTPNLIVPTQPGDEMDQDTVEAVAPPPGHAQTQAQPGIPSIKKENTIDGLPAPSQPTTTTNDIPSLITATNSNLPAGRVGTLNIHQSGRATIDWGGISFELTKGSDVEFLQDAVVASESKPLGGGSPTEDSADRQIWAMSQVSGKFVVTPDWEKMLE